MRRVWLIVGSALMLLAAASGHLLADRAPEQTTATAAPAARPAPIAPASNIPQQALVQKYCASCHSNRTKTGGVSFEGLDPAQAFEFNSTWTVMQAYDIAVVDVAVPDVRLPEEQRAVVLLVGLEQFTYEETARVLGVPTGTVMSRLSRARERLRVMLGGEAKAAPLKVVK